MMRWFEKPLRIVDVALPRSVEALRGLDLKGLAECVARHGYNAQHLTYSVGSDGENKFFLFPTESAREVPRDVLGEYLPCAKERGVRVFIYMNVHWVSEDFIADHPDWVQRKRDGSHLRGLYGGKGGSPCVNTPWRDWIFRLVAEMAERYELDGIFLDGPCFYAGTCYCGFCAEKFRDRYGTDIGEIADERHPLWAQFLEFRYDSIAEFVRDCREVLRRYRPEAPLYMNANGLYSGAMNGRHNRKLIKVQDLLGAEGGFLFYERPLDVPLWKVSATAKLLEAQAEGKPRVIFISADHKPWWRYFLPEPELRLCIAATVSCGASPWIGFSALDFDHPALKPVAEEMAFLSEHEEVFTDTQGKAEVALLWSYATADFYRAHLPEIDFMVDRPEAVGEVDYLTEFYGVYEALVRRGVPFAIVDDVGVVEEDALAGKRILILPDVACLSEEVVSRIEAFVRNGGLLIATNHTSLFDPQGERRSDFALGDVFGASYREARGLFRWEFFRLSEKGRESLGVPHADVPAPGYHVRVRARPDAEIWATFYEPLESRYAFERRLSDDPAIIRHRYGKGECLYLAGNFGRSFWLYRFAEYLTLLTYRVDEAPLVRVVTDGGVVEVTVREKRETGEWFVHLINYTGEMERPMKRLVALRDVAVQVRSERKPEGVRALRCGQTLSWHRDGEIVTVTLPLLKHHEILRFRWETG